MVTAAAASLFDRLKARDLTINYATEIDVDKWDWSLPTTRPSMPVSARVKSFLNNVFVIFFLASSGRSLTIGVRVNKF